MTIADAAARLYANDPSAVAYGIELLSADHDGAEVRMTLRPEMCNGFEIAHGGMTFLLADSAMAFASNAAGGVAYATSATIDWAAPVRAGEVLTARARRRSGSGRSAVWDISIRTDDDVEVAVFRGRTRLVTPPGEDQRARE